MDEQQQDDIVARLEGAIADWNAVVARSDQGLSERIARAKQQFESAAEAFRRETAARAASAAPSGLDALRAELASARGDGERMREEIERLRQALGERERSRESAAERAGVLESSLLNLRAEAARLREELAQARADAHDRAAELEQARAEWAAVAESAPADSGLSPVIEEGLREDLAQALRDRQEAYQEIVALRAEADRLRRLQLPPLLAPRGVRPTPAGVEIPLETVDEKGHKRRIGELLVATGVITEEQLREALEEQETSRHRRLGEIFVERGYTAEGVVAQVLACQLQLPFVRIEEFSVAPGAPRLISERLAIHHTCIPLYETEDQVVLAMVNPLDLIAIEDVELASGRRVSPIVATASDIAAAIGRYYGGPPR